MRLLAVDLDGTLLRTDKTLSNRTLDALEAARASGVEIVIATARPPRTVASLLPAHLATHVWLCFNGSVIVEHDSVLAEFLIDKEVANTTIGALQSALPSTKFKAEVDIGHVDASTFKATERYLLIDAADGVSGPVAKILAKLDEDDRRILMNETFASLPSECRPLITDNGQLLQITSSLATKGQALAHLLEIRGVNWSDVVAFGDDVNDHDMLENVTIGLIFDKSIGLKLDTFAGPASA